MHSAASSLSSWLDVVANLTPRQRAEIRLLDFSVSQFRTFAGVHYRTDNRAGLALGRDILKEKLPGYLASRYSCDANSSYNIKTYVAQKINTLAAEHPLDWATWEPDFWRPPAFEYQAGAAESFARPSGCAES